VWSRLNDKILDAEGDAVKNDRSSVLVEGLPLEPKREGGESRNMVGWWISDGVPEAGLLLLPDRA
jgi:hypothetical protein